MAKGTAAFRHEDVGAHAVVFHVAAAPNLACALLPDTAMSNTKVSPSSTHGSTTTSSSMMENARERVGDAAGAAAEKFDEATSRVGDKMHRAADRIGHEGVRGRASEKLESAGNYLSTADYEMMVEDVAGVIRDNPVPAVLVAAGLGFAIGRLLS